MRKPDKIDKHWPAPTWFRVLSKIFPGRCREVPEPLDPSRVLIRQFAIIKQRAYLQQFASGENESWYHSHPFRKGTIAIGLRGALLDRKFGHYVLSKRYEAPYFRYMGPAHIHQTILPTPDHLSIFIGLGSKTDEKWYFKEVTEDTRVHWTKHIIKKVKRI